MAEPLFEFNDAFIGAMAGGLDDADAMGLIEDGLQGMGNEVARSIESTYGEDLPVSIDGNEITVWLDDAAAAEEFGDGQGAMPAQRVSSGVERARTAAERSFEGVLGADDRR